MGQAANSFIAVACSDGNLVLVDQHAAHERVRLEDLTAQVTPSVPLFSGTILSKGLELRLLLHLAAENLDPRMSWI